MTPIAGQTSSLLSPSNNTSPCSRFFFAHFFILLLTYMSIAQWAVPTWIFAILFPVWDPSTSLIHVLMPLSFFLLNLSVLRFLRRLSYPPTSIQLLTSLYFAYAFTAAFCSILLLLCSALYSILWLLLRTFFYITLLRENDLHRLQFALQQGLQWSSTIGLSTVIGAFLYGYTRGQRKLQITRLALPFTTWPQTWHDLKIVYLSDLHIGPNIRSNSRGR